MKHSICNLTSNLSSLHYGIIKFISRANVTSANFNTIHINTIICTYRMAIDKKGCTYNVIPFCHFISHYSFKQDNICAYLERIKDPPSLY